MSLGMAMHAQRSQTPSFVSTQLDDYIKKGMQEWKIPGMAVAIVKGNEIVHMKGYGVASELTGEAVDANTMFQIGSITKSFTATAATILHVEKKISLLDKVNKWLPYFKLKNPLITSEINLTDLLSHRVGLNSYAGDLVSYGSDLSRQEVVQHMSVLPIERTFRASYGYSNSAYVAVGEALSKATGTSWEWLIKEHILTPLKMNRTAFSYKELSSIKNVAMPHTLIDNKVTEVERGPINNIAPAGSMSSSISDMTHWLMAQIDGGRFNQKQAIPERAIRMTRRPQSFQGFNQSNTARTHFYAYGLGYFVRDIEGVLSFQHSGGITGFSANHIIVPDKKLGIVVLTNNDTNGFYLDLTNVILDSYFDLPFTDYSAESLVGQKQYDQMESDRLDSLKRLVEVNVGPSMDIEQFIGSYKNDVYGSVEISFHNGELSIELPKQSSLRGTLQYMGRNTFLCTFPHYEYGTISIPFLMGKDRVRGFELMLDNIEGNSYYFKKKYRNG